MRQKLLGRGSVGKRPAPGRPRKFAHEDIVAAALAVMEKEGFGALTLRSLALELGISHSNLYNYVANIEDVEAEVLQSLVAQAPLPVSDQPARLREELIVYLRAALNLLRQHPHVMFPPIGSPAWKTFASLTHAWIVALSRHEPEPFAAIRAYSALIAYVASQAERDRLYGRGHVARTFAALHKAFPGTGDQYAAIERVIANGDTDELVTQTLGGLIDRLLPALAAPAARNSKSRKRG